MSTFKLVAIFLSIILLASCGGGGGSTTPTPTPTATPTPTNSEPIVSIVSPTVNQTAAGFALDISINASDPDAGDEVESVNVIITDSTATVVFEESLTTAPYVASWSLVDIADGSYSVAATALSGGKEGVAESSFVVNNPDIDGDGWSTADEITCGSNPLDVNGLPADPDADEICNVVDQDDDGDGWDDTVELSCGTDSLNVGSVPLDTDNDEICNELDQDPVYEGLYASDLTIFKRDLFGKELTVAARVTGTEVAYIETRFEFEYDNTLLTIRMDDDGNNGDVAAEDHVFGANFSLGIDVATELRAHGGRVDQLEMELFFFDEQGTEIILTDSQKLADTTISIGIFEEVNPVEITQVTDSIWRTNNVVNIVVPSTHNGSNEELIRAEALSTFCSMYPGTDFDIIEIVEHFTTIENKRKDDAHFSIISNQIEGIGLKISDGYNGNTGIYTYGCLGLQGVIYTSNLDRVGRTFVHEFTHRWAMYLNSNDLPLSYSAFFGSLVWDTAHWGHSSMCEGVLKSGMCFIDDGDGTLSVNYVFNMHLRQLSAIEMYLAGLFSPSEVGSIWFAFPGTYVEIGTNISKSNPGMFEMTMDNLIAIHGQRIPAQGQTKYSVGRIIVSEERIPDAAFALESFKSSYHEGSGLGDSYTGATLKTAYHEMIEVHIELPIQSQP